MMISEKTLSTLLNYDLQIAQLRVDYVNKLSADGQNEYEDVIASLEAHYKSSQTLKKGAIAPNFTLNNAFGESVELYDALEYGPVILTFYRGRWCPFCNLYLRILNSSQEYFKNYSAQIIAVSPQTPDNTLQVVTNQNLDFEVLSDIGNKIATDYGVAFEVPLLIITNLEAGGVDIGNYNGGNSTTLPIPSTFIIREDKVVEMAHADADYTRRASPQEILKILDTL